MRISSLLLPALVLSLAASCGLRKPDFDASGTFEAEELIISAEANGRIMALDLSEGQSLTAGQVLGYVDSVQLALRRTQLEASIQAALARRPNAGVQIAALETQLATATRERERVRKLVEADAATRKQLDDVDAQIEVLKKQIAAQQNALGITTQSISSETVPISVQIDQVRDMLAKCKIINPVNGTVLTQYARAHEVTAAGKPLYKIADLSQMTLRAYLSASQLGQIKLGQTVRVFVDDGPGKQRELPGTVTWVSDKAEFTPKTIQTQDERANLVYAMKIRVKNDGSLKIGMYGEVKFQ